MNTVLSDYAAVKFEPLHDRLLVRRIPQPQEGLIYIPDIAQQNSQLAEVVAKGKRAHGVDVGDIVLLPGVAAKYPDWEHSDLMFVEVGDVGGILTPDQA